MNFKILLVLATVSLIFCAQSSEEHGEAKFLESNEKAEEKGIEEERAKLTREWSDGLEEIPSNVQYYTIKKGDTLSKIAKMYSTTVEKLCRWNNISNPNYIVAGKRIRVA